MANIRKSSDVPKVEILANTDGLGHKCLVCGTPLEKKVHSMFLLGHSYFSIANVTGFHRMTIKTHIRAMGLDKKRKMSTLKQVQGILKEAKKNGGVPSDNLIAKCLELQAKLTGELDEKPVTNIGIVVTDELRQKRFAEGLDRFGVRVENVSTDE